MHTCNFCFKLLIGVYGFTAVLAHQARAIISMASEETLAADHRRRQREQLMRGDDDSGDGRHHDGDSSSSSTSAVARRCARDRGLVRPSAAVALAPSLVAAGVVVGSPRQGGFAGGAVAAPVLEIDPAAASGLSMKRSLQLFLQKRKARTAAAGARQAQAVRR
jgi:hypothetical protein